MTSHQKMLGAQMRAWASSWMQVGSRRQHFTCPADPSQWWDSRRAKINPGSPNFRHKARRKALWVDGWSTPQWAIQGELQPPVGHRAQGPQDVVRPSYPRRMVREEVLNLLMPESRGKMYKLSMLLCAGKVQVR